MTKNIFALIIAYALGAATITMWLTYKSDDRTTLAAGERDEQWQFLKDVAMLIQYADAQGYKLTGGELYRTMAQQRLYVLSGRSKTFNSRHLKRKAIDLNLFVNNKYCSKPTKECLQAWRNLGVYWQMLSEENRYGGFWKSFRDFPHYERR